MNVADKTFIDELKKHAKIFDFTAFADRLRVSRPSVACWLEGKNLPAEGIQEEILKALQNDK